MNLIGCVFVITAVILIIFHIGSDSFSDTCVDCDKESCSEWNLKSVIKKINSELDGVNKVFGVVSIRKKLSYLYIV
jgi:hypothetical protein